MTPSTTPSVQFAPQIQYILQHSLSHLQNTFHRSTYVTLVPSLHTSPHFSLNQLNLLGQSRISTELMNLANDLAHGTASIYLSK